MASRVTLLEAVEMDEESYDLLKRQLSKATKFLSTSFLVKWEAEIDAILRFAIWRLSVCDHDATFGQQLVSVGYGRSFTRRKARLLVILTVFSHYAKQKISNMTVEPSSESEFSDVDDSENATILNKVKKLLTFVETGVWIASLLNLLMFLRQGKYPTLIDRLLRLTPELNVKQGRTIGYRYMTRELLWHGFIELITFTLPLINYRLIKKKVVNLFYKDAHSKKKLVSSIKYSLTDETQCAVCNQRPILPHHIKCQHVFCYYCLQSNFSADSDFECPECGQPAKDNIDQCCMTL